MWMNQNYTRDTGLAILCAACMFFTTIIITMDGSLTTTSMTQKMITMVLLLMWITLAGMVMRMILKSSMLSTAQTAPKDFFQKMKCSKFLDIYCTKTS